MRVLAIPCNEYLPSLLVSLFNKHGIPLRNLCSILMDSCAVMCGSKSCLETRIRNDKASHLLGVDCDVCHHIHNVYHHIHNVYHHIHNVYHHIHNVYHHIHNSSKKISVPFDNFTKALFTNLANHFKWSTYLRQYLEEVCQLLSKKFTMPERVLTLRWLSCYDVAVSTH